MEETSLARRAAVALAATAVACAVQTAFLRLELRALPPAYFASQALFIGAIVLPATLALAPLRSGRVTAALLFTAPGLLATAPVALDAAGVIGLLALAGAALAFVAAWSRLSLGPGAPIFAAAAGTALGGLLLAAEREDLREPTGAALLAAAAAGCLGLALAAGRLPRAAYFPRTGPALALAALAGLGAAALAGLGGRPGPTAAPAHGGAPRPSIVLIVLDTVRADRLGVYGGPRDTMPRLDAFGRAEGTRVLRGTAGSPWTLPSHASFFTGLHPPRHGAHGPTLDDSNPPTVAYPMREEVPTLAGLLAQHGYWSVGLSANFASISPEFGVARGFDHYRAEPGPLARISARAPWRLNAGWPLELLDLLPPFASCEFFGRPVPYARAATMTDAAIAALDASGDRPLFLFVNYMDAHRPYQPPLAAPSSTAVRDSILAGDTLDPRPILAGERELGAEEQEALLALYDAELAYLDAQLSRLLERLRRDPRWPEMLVVVTSDHGEAFGEHGLVTHGHALYEEMLRVPALVKPGPSTPRLEGSDAVLESVDIFPLALEHAGLEVPAGIDGSLGDGESPERILAWKYRGSRWPEIERLQTEARSLRIGSWKLIENRPGPLELYDLSRDPGELRNLAEHRPERAARLRAALPARRSRATPVEDVVDPDLEESLRALGYVD